MHGVMRPESVIEPNVTKGQRFVLSRSHKPIGLTSWSAPFTGSFECTAPEGTLLEVISDSVLHAPGFACRPVNYTEFELEHVPESDRTSENTEVTISCFTKAI